MTVTATTAFSGPFTPNGSTTAFPFTFVAASTAEIEVFRLSAAEGITDLGGYTVTLNGDGTGTVNFAVAPAVGDPIYIISKPSFAQSVAFANQGAWSPTTLDSALDANAIRNIYLKNRTDRALLVPLGESGSTLPPAAVRANKVPAFDILGNLYTPNVAASDLEILAAIAGAVSIVAAVAANVTTVAGSIANVNTVAGSITNVNAVGLNIASVNTCATNIAAILAAPGQAAAAAASAASAAATASAFGGVNETFKANVADITAGGDAASVVDSDGRVLLALAPDGYPIHSHPFAVAIGTYAGVDNTIAAIQRLPRTGLSFTFPAWWGLSIAGQSNAAGNTEQVLTTSQPFSNKKWNGSAVVPLVEAVEETIASAATAHAKDHLLKILPPWASFPQDWVTYNMGVGGAPFSSIQKGTTTYNNGLAAVTGKKAAATAAGKSFAEMVLVLLHGEADSQAGTTQATYLADLIQFKNDWNTDVAAITGQTNRIPLFIVQMGKGDGTQNGSANEGPLLAMLQAAETDGEIFVIQPGYQATYRDDGLHYLAHDMRLIGEQIGKACHRFFVDGRNPSTVRPLAWSIKDPRTIHVDLFVPVPPLQWDIDTVWPMDLGMGFGVLDLSSVPVGLNGVSILPNGTSVDIRTTADITTGFQVTYALNLGVRNTTGGIGSGNRKGARGCLRDSDRTAAFYTDADGNPYQLSGWCAPFRKTL